ncbi:MAG: hypothetical protein IPK83_08475 [Planctomycetes bacterium]|nr:hypothetical protein [Planctomycetota bacterium]
MALAGAFEGIQRITAGFGWLTEALTAREVRAGSDQWRRTKVADSIRAVTKSHEPVTELQVEWFDLLGSKEGLEFFAHFNQANETYGCLCSLRGGSLNTLFLESGFDGEFEHATFEGRQYALIARKAGSGGYLELTIASWDGIGELKSEVLISEDSPTLPVHWGNLLKVQDRIFIVGNGQKLELVLRDSFFIMERYLDHPKYPHLGKQIHIVRLCKEADSLQFFFDDQRIEFYKNGDVLLNKTPIEIGLNETVLIDDNIESRRVIRTFGEADMLSWESGLYSKFTANKVGVFSVRIDDSYGNWCELTFHAVRRVERE